MVKYGNRPQVQMKRPHPMSTQVPNFKRQAHRLQITDDEPDTSNQVCNYYGNHYPDYHSEFSYPNEHDIAGNEIEQYPYEPGNDFTQNSEPNQMTNEPQPSTSQQAHFLDWHPSW